MQEVLEQKTRLEQRKNRLAQEEIRLKLKERKIRTRRLIELGGLVVKAGLDFLPHNTVYGALLSLNESLQKTPDIKTAWTTKGSAAFKKEQRHKTAIILKFTEQPDGNIRGKIRDHGLKWNRIRSEWYGYVTDLPSLKKNIANMEHSLEIINS